MNFLKNIISTAAILGVSTSVFIPTQVLSKPSPTASSNYVKIDLSTQRATLYKDNEVVKTFLILTGKNSTPTPTGTYKINGNRQYTPNGNNITLTGSYGTAKVGIWNPFIGNSIAFHNAPWRKEYEFGNTERRKKYGSHGCINMRYQDALFLYKNTKVGTTVIVTK